MRTLEIRNISRGLVTDMNPGISPPDYSSELLNLLPDGGRLILHPDFSQAIIATIDITGGEVFDAGDFYDTNDKWRAWVSCRSVVGSDLQNRLHVLNDAGTGFDAYGPFTPEYRYSYTYAGYLILHDGSNNTNDLIFGYFPSRSYFNNGRSDSAATTYAEFSIESPRVRESTHVSTNHRMISISVTQVAGGHFSAGDEVKLGFSLKYERQQYSYLTELQQTYVISADDKALSIDLKVDEHFPDYSAHTSYRKWPITHIVVWLSINGSDWRRWGEIDLNSGVVDDADIQRNWNFSSPEASISFVINGSPLVDSYEAVTGYNADDVNKTNTAGSIIGTEKKPAVAWKVAGTYKNRVLYGDVTVNGVNYNDRIYVSQIGRPGVVPGYAYFDLGTADGDQIVDIKAAEDIVYVIKSRHIYVLDASSYDPAGWRVIGSHTGPHVTTKRQSVVVDNKLFIADSNGLWLVAPDGVVKVSKPYETAWQSYPPSVLGLYRARKELLALKASDGSGIDGFNIAINEQNSRLPYSACRVNVGTILPCMAVYPLIGSNNSGEFYSFIHLSDDVNDTLYLMMTDNDSVKTETCLFTTSEIDIGPVYIKRVELVGDSLMGGVLGIHVGANIIDMDVPSGSSVVTLRGGIRTTQGFRINYSIYDTRNSSMKIEKLVVYYDELPLTVWR